MKKELTGKIIYNKKLATDTFELAIQSNLKEAKAGQFISILIPNKTLRRPFSINNFSKGKVTVLYKLKGDGTKYISNLKEGEEVNFLAPLGNTFNYNKSKRVLLIGAGIGIAPMLFLKKELNNNKIENFLISGFKNKEEVIENSDKTVIGGSVLDNIEALIDDYKPDLMCSCGPKPVLKILSEIGKKKNIESQLAMEKIMACGIGVCRGCVVETISGNKTVCKDGPVFLGDEIIW